LLWSVREANIDVWRSRHGPYGGWHHYRSQHVTKHNIIYNQYVNYWYNNNHYDNNNSPI